MAEKHYVDPKDQHIAAEAVPTHSELAGMYRNKKEETLGPWMQEDERQAAIEKEHLDTITGLRKSSLRIGFNLGLPFVLGILLVQLAFYRAGPGINQADAMVLAFVLLFLLAGSAILTFFLFKQVGKRFRDHTLRALPVTLTTLLSLVFLVHPLFKLTNMIAGIAGFIAWLLSFIVASILISVILVFIWTEPKIPDFIKVLVLLLVFGASVAAMYLL